MRNFLTTLFAGAVMVCGAPESATAQVAPDPSRELRWSQCVQFERTLPPICNFNPALPLTDRSECDLYFDQGGTVRILCAEDHPRYPWMQRLAAVARSCGENSFRCMGAYFEREYGRCIYQVVPDHWATNPYQVRISDLPYEQRILLVREEDGYQHRRYGRRFLMQERDLLRNERRQGMGWTDPCRY